VRNDGNDRRYGRGGSAVCRGVDNVAGVAGVVVVVAVVVVVVHVVVIVVIAIVVVKIVLVAVHPVVVVIHAGTIRQLCRVALFGPAPYDVRSRGQMIVMEVVSVRFRQHCETDGDLGLLIVKDLEDGIISKVRMGDNGDAHFLA